MSTAATILVLLVAAIHGYILVLEMFLWQTPRAMRAFGTDAEFAARTKVMAANQGLYNGFLAAGLVWGVLAGAGLGTAVDLFFLGCVIVAGLYGGATVSKRILLVQVVPAVAAMAAVLVAGGPIG